MLDSFLQKKDHGMPNTARVVVARDNWKKLAVRRRKEAESKARQAQKWKSRYASVIYELTEAKKKIFLLEQEVKKKSSNSYTDQY